MGVLSDTRPYTFKLLRSLPENENAWLARVAEDRTLRQKEEEVSFALPPKEIGRKFVSV
jgi:hypothetical protein